MRKFGLIGFPLSHSFSKKYFTKKFQNEDILDCEYELYPLETIEQLTQLLKMHPELKGLNVTIPYKQAVFPFLNEIEESAAAVGAVNVIKIENGKLKGYNSDVYGFEQSLRHFLKKQLIKNALILGTGGAAKAIAYVLKKLAIDFKKISRSPEKGDLIYSELNKTVVEQHPLIINTTPLGTYPNTEIYPNLPYNNLTPNHFLFDLVYNPEKTLFLSKGEQKGAHICNGLAMLHLQAEKAWEIWNNDSAY